GYNRYSPAQVRSIVMGTSAPRSKFASFRAQRLQNSTIRAAYEDAHTRNGLIDALVRRRRLLGFNQTQVAKSMGVGQPTVSGFETEGSDPKLSTLQRYARAVNASIWVEVVPKGQRVEFYFARDVELAPEAARSDATDRAMSWSRSGARYNERHLAAVC
ncbi:MAG: helix-turn-helix domain-containing protein, partial [Jiangellaceae bacterium]